jgi:hypothetical protein
MTVERDPRAATAQQYSKGLILLKKQTTYLSKALILRAYETGTFCIDCTGTPIYSRVSDSFSRPLPVNCRRLKVRYTVCLITTLHSARITSKQMLSALS